MRSVLIIEDEKILAENIAKYLSRMSFNSQVAHNMAEAAQRLEKHSFDIILIDYNLPDGDGIQFISQLRQQGSESAIVMITGEGSVEIAVEAMKAGADDYLSKPLALKELAVLLNKIKRQQHLKNYLTYHHRRLADKDALDKIVGVSKTVTELKTRIEQVIKADRELDNSLSPTVLISGETGSGKELVAKAIHFCGPRADMPFVEINCSAIPSELLESELFGNEKGAFTGAVSQHSGLIESAEGGTLFIDEIGDMELRLQAKLLKVIEDKRYRRLGDSRERVANVRFISATHRNLRALIESGEFREDLYYRLKVVTLNVPALRERGGDIPLLASHFLKLYAHKYNKPNLTFSAEALKALAQHSWPGNVRELKACIEQAALMGPTEEITPQDLAFSRTDLGGTAAIDSDFKDGLSLEKIEKALIKRALNESNGNITQAAKTLDLTRDTLRYRIEKYGIQY